jgi:hypothetical protein
VLFKPALIVMVLKAKGILRLESFSSSSFYQGELEERRNYFWYFMKLEPFVCMEQVFSNLPSQYRQRQLWSGDIFCLLFYVVNDACSVFSSD